MELTYLTVCNDSILEYGNKKYFLRFYPLIFFYLVTNELLNFFKILKKLNDGQLLWHHQKFEKMITISFLSKKDKGPIRYFVLFKHLKNIIITSKSLKEFCE